MNTILNNFQTYADTNALLNFLISNNLKLDVAGKKQVKTIKGKAKPTKLNNFWCAPEKNGKTSNVKFLTKYLGIEIGDRQTLKTDFISTKTEILYNGFQLSLKLIGDEVFIVMKSNQPLEIKVKDVAIVIKENQHSELKCWSVSRIASCMKKQNPFISENNVRTLLLDGSLKVKFNVSTTKDHGTLWKVSK